MNRPAEIVGVWELSGWGWVRDDGPLMPFGGSARSRLIYEASGGVSAHLDRASVSNPSDRQVYSYSGAWSVDSSTASHALDLSNIPQWIGTTLKRTVLLLDATRLHLETPPVRGRNGSLKDVLEWIRRSGPVAREEMA